MARIVHLTDLHLRSGRASEGSVSAMATGWFRSWGDHARRNLDELFGHLAQRTDVDFIVVTGDIASECHPATYGHLRGLLEPWKDRCLVVPGNHDHRGMVWTALGEVASAEGVAKGGTLGPCPRRLMGVRDLGEVRVIGLDTLEAGRVCGNLGDEQRDWLSQELSRSEKPTLLFMHHPPMRVGTWWLDKDLLRDLVPFETHVRRSPVVAIFAGHVHQEAEGQLGPVPVFATPSTAYQFPPRSWCPRSARTKASYRWIDARRDRVKSHVVRL